MNPRDESPVGVERAAALFSISAPWRWGGEGMNCQTCGGLIMEPNRSYQYSGPVCYCARGQQAGRPNIIIMQDLAAAMGKIAALEAKIAGMDEQLKGLAMEIINLNMRSALETLGKN